MENRRGIFLMILSMLLFAIADGFAKASAAYVEPGDIIFAIAAGGFVFFFALAKIKGLTIWQPSLMFKPAVILRGIVEIFGVVGIVTALTRMDLAIVSAVQNTTPLLVTMFAALLLKETVGWRRWSAIAVGFACVILIFRPGANAITPAVGYVIMGTVALSVRDLSTRYVPKDAPSLLISLYAYFALLPAAFVLALLQGGPSAPSAALPLLLAMTATASVAYLLITVATRTGELSATIPFRYSRLLFAIVIGYVVFSERPDVYTLLGAVGIVASGLFLLHRERTG